MRSMCRVWALVLTASAALGGGGVARAGQTDAGVTVLLIHGQHVEQSGSANVPLVPAPVIDASHRFARLELSAEGIPPLGAFPVGANSLGIQSIGLSYLQGAARYWNAAGTFAIGAGETLYNQRTNYVMSSSNAFVLGQYDASRVAGALYEIAGKVQLHGIRIEASVDVNPVLHGSMHWTDYQTVNGSTTTIDLQPDWERGSQFAAILEFSQPEGAFELHYGVRYLNYVAHFNDGSLADRNTFAMPFIGFSRNL